MSTNYWIEQYNKEVLSAEIEKHLHRHPVAFDPSMTEDISREIASYLRKIGKTKYKVYIRMTPQSAGYKLTIEIP